MKSPYFLFLDDVREPVQIKWADDMPSLEVVVARDFLEFQSIVKTRGIPEVVSFDFDLCPEHYAEFRRLEGMSVDYRTNTPTGLDCAKWLKSFCGGEPFPKFFVHSLNPAGKRVIFRFLQAFRCKSEYGPNASLFTL